MISDVRHKLEEILQRARDQIAISAQLRQEVHEIHERIVSNDFLFIPRAPDRHPRVQQRKGKPR